MCVTQTSLRRALLCKAKPPACLGTLALLFKMLAVLQSSSVLIPWDRWPQLGCASEISSPPSRCQRGWVSSRALPGIPTACSSIPSCWLPAVSHTQLPSPTSPCGLEALLVPKIPRGG